MALRGSPVRDCIKCLTAINHPFHDNGSQNSDCDISEFSMPDWHRDENGEIVG